MPKHSEKPLFARNIAYLRYQKGLTGRKIQEKTGICQTTWWSWEYGTSFPSSKFLTTICEVLEFYDLYSMLTVDLSVVSKVKNEPLDHVLRTMEELKRGIEKLKI